MLLFAIDILSDVIKSLIVINNFFRVTIKSLIVTMIGGRILLFFANNNLVKGVS